MATRSLQRLLSNANAYRQVHLYSVQRFRSTTTSGALELDKVRPFEEIPSPGGIYDVPLIGTALLFKPFTNYTPSTLHHLFREFYEKHGDITKFRAGKDWMVMLFNPDYVQRVCMEPIKNPYRPPLDLLVTYFKRNDSQGSIGILNGEEWAAFRKPAQDQILRPTIVANYVPLINDVADDFVQNLKKMSHIDNCLDEFYKYTTESVGMLCFNKRLGCLDDNPNVNIMPSIKQFFRTLGASTFSKLRPFKYLRTPLYKEFETAANELQKLVMTHIEQRKLEDKNTNADNSQPGTEEPNLLKTLLSDPRLTAEQTSRLIQDLFNGGVDSTANSMTLLLYNLSKFPDKQELLYQEIASKLSPGEPVTREILGNMPYLKACVKESFRIYHPIAGGGVRVFDHDIAVGGYNIPKHTVIVMGGSVISRNDKYYKDAKDFVPERWLRDSNDYNQQKINSFGQLPFGFGARSCIGQRFAENEIYIAMIKMIQNFKFSLPPDAKEMDFEYQIFATPKYPLNVILEQR